MAAQLVRLSPVTPLSKIEGILLSRFYTDGTTKPLAPKLITSIAKGEMYFVINTVECLLNPRGYNPSTALQGGKPMGRKLLNVLGNLPHELGGRNRLMGMALRGEYQSLFSRDRKGEAGMDGN